MVTFEYNCIIGEHLVSERFEMGKAPDTFFCVNHQEHCKRSFGNTKIVSCSDEFRAAWLSGKPQGNIFEQSPRDKYEAKEMGKQLGRVYVGNDPAKHGMKMSPAMIKKYYG